MDCIAIQSLCRDTTQAGRAGLSGSARRSRRAGRKRERGARGRARGRGARGSRHGSWARGLGVLLGCGLCTWCTQPVFDPV